MKNIFIISGIIAAVLTALIAILPISNLAVLPAVAALFFGLVAYYLSKKDGYVKKIVPFIFYLTLTALSISAYKAIFNKSEIANNKILEEKEANSETEAIQELESLDIDVDELEALESN